VVLGLWQDRDPLEALETARAADELGYSELWIGEMATFDAFALASAIGAQTESLTLTVGPLAVSVRDPMAIAMGVASVAALSGRPVNVALGASSPIVVGDWHGRPYDHSAQRLRETAEALRPLLAGERVSYEGELVRTRNYRLRLAVPQSSLTIAAFGEQAVRVAAGHADRMVINLATVEGAGLLRERLDAAAEAAPPPLAAWVVGCVDPTDEALEQMCRSLVAYLAAPGYGEMFEAAGLGELVEFARTSRDPSAVLARVPRELPAAVGLVGDLATCRSRAAAYRAAGVDQLAIIPVTAGDPGGRRTLEALREL
jgi:probable F420-dependent oxidoreductase